MNNIDTDVKRRARLIDIENEIKEDEKAKDEARKNSSFTQVYSPGWMKLREIISNNPQAAKLFTLLAEEIDASCGAVICSQDFLAKRLGVSVRTVQRYLDYLEVVENVLVRIQMQGRVYAYALNPELVWRGYNTSKDYAAFVSKTLINKDDEINKRLKVLMTNYKQSEIDGAKK